MSARPGVPQPLTPLRILIAAVLLAAVAVSAPDAAAQSCTSFVNATDGDDSNPGSQILPWRSVEYAFETADQGETVCLAAGEYFYGPDADGIEFDVPGKSVDFVLRAFAGETDVRFSEQALRVNAGTGVIRFLSGTSNALVLGRGILNSDDPTEPGLLNFLHTLALESGTLDVSGVSFSIEEPVGNPEYVNPDNESKSAPSDAAIRIGSGRLIGNPDWMPSPRSFLYAASGTASESTFTLPSDLSGSLLAFAQPGTIRFPFDVDARGARLRFDHDGVLEFLSDVRFDAATTELVWDSGSTGSVTFSGDLLVSSSAFSDSELAFTGSGDVQIDHLTAVSALNGSHSARFVHDSGGTLRVGAFEMATGAGSGPFELTLANLSGTLEAGVSGSAMNPAGPIENRDLLVLSGDISLSQLEAESVVNTGSIDLRTYNLDLSEAGSSLINSGSVLSTSTTSGRVRALADATVAGGGVLRELEVSGGQLTLDSQTIDGRLTVTSGGRLDLVADAVVDVSGDVLLHSDPSFSSAVGTITLSGDAQMLSVPSGDTFPSFRIAGGDVVLSPTSTSLPGVSVEGGTLTADVVGGLSVQGLLRVSDGLAVVRTSDAAVFSQGASVESGTLVIDSPEPVSWNGPVETGSGMFDFRAPALRPLPGSTIDFAGSTPIVLPTVLLGTSGATLRVSTRLEVNSDLTLSSGVVLFENGGSIALFGNLGRSSGRFEPSDESVIEFIGTARQEVSGFSGSVLPSVRMSGSDVAIAEPVTILGDIEAVSGSTTVSNGVQVNLSGAFVQSGGAFRLTGGSSLFAAGGLDVSGGIFEAGSGSIRSSADVILSSAGVSAADADLVLDGVGQRPLTVETDVRFRSLTVRANATADAGGAGSLTVSGAVGIRAGARLRLAEGFEIRMTGTTAAPVLSNAGRTEGDGFIRLVGPSGGDPFVLSGGGTFGAISVETSGDGDVVRLMDMDTLRVSGTVRFISGGIDAAGRRVQLVTEGSTPGIILNLQDSITSAGTPDGRGFVDSTGPLDLATDGGLYDLEYMGSLTAPYTAGAEYIPGGLRNLSIGSPDAVNTPPVFGVSLGGSARIPGSLTVSPSSLLRLNAGALFLSGESAVHRVDGRVVGAFDTVLEGAGSTILSTDASAFIRSLVVDASPTANVLVSGLAGADRFRIDAGHVSIAGARTLNIGTSLGMISGQLTFGTGVTVGSPGTAGILDVAGADVMLDVDSFVEFPFGAAISFAQDADVSLTSAARVAQNGRTGFIILRDESTVRAPAGIPRLSLDPVQGSTVADDFYLSGDLEISDTFLFLSGDLFLGSNVLRLSGGAMDYDTDGAPFDGQRDEIVGDVSGGGGVIEVTAGVDFRLGTDMLVQGATMIVDAAGHLVRIVSTSPEPRQLHVAALPLELRAGTIDLGTNDLRVTGSSANLLYLGDIDVIGTSAPQPPPGLHPLLSRDSGSFPLDDRDFGELVVDGSGNASIAVTHPVDVPSLRVDGTVRLPVTNEELTVSRRLVFGRDGATILTESAADLRLAAGAAIVRRGEGTLARVPVFAGPVDVFYDLDDGSISGTDSRFEGTLSTGLELPAAVRRLGVLAGGEPSAPDNSVQLASDVTVGRLLAVYSGRFHRGDRVVNLADDALLAVNQLDADAPSAFTGTVDWTGTGAVDVLLGAAVERIDPDASVLPPGVSVDSLIVSMGRPGGPAITVRQRIPLVVRELVVEAPGPRGTYRFDGMNVVASGGIRIVNSAMLTSTLASLESGADLTVASEAELSGSVDAVVGGNFNLQGHFGGLSLDLAGHLDQTGTIAGAARLRFSGSDQTWNIPRSFQTGVVELDMTSPTSGPPILRLTAASGAVGRTLDVNGALHLNGGLLDTGQQRVRLAAPDGGFTRNPEAGSGTVPPSHIMGTIVRHAEVETTEPIVFPVGDETAFRPLTLAFPQALISATDLGVRFEPLPFASRNGLPTDSPDGVVLRDAAAYGWRLTSSVNFAQSQPATVTVMIDESISGDPEQHRLLRRSGGDLSAPWTAVGGSPVVSLVESGIQVRSVGATGLLAPEGVSLGIGVPDLLYANEARIQIINMAPGAVRDILLTDEPILRGLGPGEAGGIITLGIDGADPEPVTLTIRDVANSTIHTTVQTTLQPNRVTVVGLTEGGGGSVQPYIHHRDPAEPPAPGSTRLGFLHLDPSAGGFDIVRGHPAAMPVFTADAVGLRSGPVTLPAEPLLLIPVPAVDGAFDIEEFRVDLTASGGRNSMIVAADAELFGASIESPFLAVVEDDGTVRAGLIVTGTEAVHDEVPTSFKLGGNFPNPFRSRTTLTFDLPEPADVRLVVADMLGRVVRRVDAGRIDAGSDRRLTFDATGLAAGVYVYRLEVSGDGARHADSGTMVVVR